MFFWVAVEECGGGGCWFGCFDDDVGDGCVWSAIAITKFTGRLGGQ